MRARFAASVLVVALVGFGTAGCAFITPQATTNIVETSDGVNATIGQVHVRNATLISEDGTLASMLVSFVNSGDDSQKLTVQYEDGATGERASQQVTVPGESAITSFGADGGEQILLNNVSKPGSLFPVYFQYGDVEGKQVLVPVLNTSLPEYDGLAPTPTPTMTLLQSPPPTLVETPHDGQAPSTGEPTPTETPAG
ncbi:hypothetical protein [Herbiconiux ginsengi]|uniref:DNA modification methylase n=1 Tax=Herbiconiux ginsengi TaxID=381665 RepID=A0A1H3JNF0_9MICO|nr:hypothetical protein [Herbiconiux ginsengi]SDY40908.1 hypothetical protein SAMN05216554_0235 [Herbiconiux ginsengi]